MSCPNLTQDVVELQTYIENIKSNIIDFIYPVGSIYMSVNNVSPAIFLGGSWEQIQDTFLLSAGSSYIAGSTGGSSTVKANVSVNNHTLTINQIPSHNHSIQHMPTAFALVDTSSNACIKPPSSGVCKHVTHYTTYNGGSQGHNHGVTITAHNNMPPYLTVYMWKRIS